MKKKTIPRAKLSIWLPNGKTVMQIAKLLEMSPPTVKTVIRRDHPEFIELMEKNGRDNHGGQED